MDIKKEFLKLTGRTYPHGTEREILPLLPEALQQDQFGNLFLQVGESDTMFTSHLDTATMANVQVTHVIEGDIIKTDGTTILGADDKAGVVIMLFMIANSVPGLYYFFLGEEVGCVGSRKVADIHKLAKKEGINKVVSFDRRGTDSVITHQSGMRCCSEKFASALGAGLNAAEPTFSYRNDSTGILTDSLQFTSIYPECTNISVGYQMEHTFSEKQDIAHLEKLALACLKVDWNSLPVERDPAVSEYFGHTGWRSKYYCYDDYDYDYDYDYSYSSGWKRATEAITDNFWFHDEKYNHISKLVIGGDKKIKSVDLCRERIEEETVMIEEFLFKIELAYTRIQWDGFKLKVLYNEKGHETECDRNELLEYIPEMDYQKTKSDKVDYDYDHPMSMD